MPIRTSKKLYDDFLVPSFSILDSSTGPWQARKRQWRDEVGIRSQLGRAENLIGYGGLLGTGAASDSGTSEFDPTLAEIILRWYAPRPVDDEPTIVLDPYSGFPRAPHCHFQTQCRAPRPIAPIAHPLAPPTSRVGGSVRGVVCSKLGYLYVGIDISKTQIDENVRQAEALCGDCRHLPRYVHGSAADVERLFAAELAALGLPSTTKASLILTCPPYWCLERYSDDPHDLSNLASFDEFERQFSECIIAASKCLAHQHAAVYVTGNVRSSSGAVNDVTMACKQAHARAKCPLYQDAILKTPNGSAPLRAGRQMAASSKMCLIHQSVSVFTKDVPLNPEACRRFRIRARDGD
jgi:hypothetical protein